LPDKSSIQLEINQLTNYLLNSTGHAMSKCGRMLIKFTNTLSFQMGELKEMLQQCMTDSVPVFISYGEKNQLHQPLPQPIIPQLSKPQAYLFKHTLFQNPILVAAFLSTICITWIFFAFMPSSGALNLCLGISLFSANISYWLNQKVGKLDTDELPAISPYAKHIEAVEESSLEYYEHLEEQTTLLVSSESSLFSVEAATVLLPKPQKAVLELLQGTSVETIPISANPFVIGRNVEVVQYAADWIGISRTHIEISRESLEYSIKDLGSKNGSFLNEEQMIPHKPYALAEGDRIKIVEKEFVYKIYS
jgi:hypothetical protein